MMDLPKGQSVMGESGVRCVSGPLFYFLSHYVFRNGASYGKKKCVKLGMYQNIFIFNLL